MALFSTNELKRLLDNQKGYCVSIYLPTHQAGPEIRQDPIRFKNLMREAEERLVEQGLRSSDAQNMLKKAQELDRDEFWRHQNNGLAIFVAQDFLSYYRLPLEFEEFVFVNERFHLKPLIPLLTGDGRFYILGLSQNQVRLLEATRDRVSEINLNDFEEVPQSLAEALKYDDPEEQLRFHSSNKGDRQQAPIYHGQGVGTTDNKDQIKVFFNRLDAGLQEFLHDKQAPLVLAGVEYLLPIYREANTYQHLLAEGITGNPEILKPEELHEQAWQIVQPHFQKAQEEALQRFQEFSGNNQDQVCQDVKEVVKAAYYQKIDSLFVTLGKQHWGSFDPQSVSVQLHEQKQTGDEDLLDLAAIHTFLNGGTVFAVEPDQVPAKAPAAAVLRY